MQLFYFFIFFFIDLNFFKKGFLEKKNKNKFILSLLKNIIKISQFLN